MDAKHTQGRMHEDDCPYDGRRHGPETCVYTCPVCGEVGHIWCARTINAGDFFRNLFSEAE